MNRADSPCIMIADDDPAILDALQMLLENEGYTVQTATNGDPIKKMHDHFPDLMLIDIWMSGEDGRELAKLLKTQNETKHIPIVLISASKDIDTSARASGADDFLAKPFEVDDLLSMVHKYITH